MSNAIESFSVEDVPLIPQTKSFSEVELIKAFKTYSMTGYTTPSNQPLKRWIERPDSKAYSGNIMDTPNDIRFKLSEYLEKEIDGYFYIDSYKNILKGRNYSVITTVDKERKTKNLLIGLLNRLFKPFLKTIEGDIFKVKLPDNYFDSYVQFVNNKLYYQTLSEHKELFDFINLFFRGLLFYKERNFSPNNMFKWSSTFNSNYTDEGFYMDEEGIVRIDLTMSFNFNAILITALNLIEFFMICEVTGLYIEGKPLPNLRTEKEQFLRVIENRRVPIEKITHKTALKEAKKLELTHVFLPLDEEAIPAGTPFSLKINTEPQKRIMNSWEILPPTNGYHVIRTYFGHNKDYENLTTKKEPHLMKEGVVRTSFSDDFYEKLLEGYDWPHKEEAEKTFELIQKYPRLKNDLIKLAKEENDD